MFEIEEVITDFFTVEGITFISLFALAGIFGGEVNPWGALILGICMTFIIQLMKVLLSVTNPGPVPYLRR